MKRLPILVLCILFWASSSPTAGGAAAPPPPPGTPEASYVAVEQAIQDAILKQQEQLPVYLLYTTLVDSLTLTEDGLWATAQLIPTDPQTGDIVPAEPGLALAQNEAGSWQVFLPNNPQWADVLQAAPERLLSTEDKSTWLQMYEQANQVTETATFGGYKLPWEAGKKLVLTQSISHYNPPDPSGSMHYSFDFATWHDASGQSQMFAVSASKSGRVKYARWWQANGDDSSPGNYLVIEDTSTSPVTYALYLHLAKDSIPLDLRLAGAQVFQGQFIGLADDTGYSSGNHLHFQVHTNPNSYWGNSVDITFSDVSINSGRPRTPSEAANWPQYGSQGQLEYMSGNTASGDHTPPTGNLTEPQTGMVLEDRALAIYGQAEDNEALASVQIKAKYGGSWQNIGPIFNSSPFNYTWDLCNDQVPDGPVSLALEIRDISGNYALGLPGLRHFLKQYECPTPPPTCSPTNTQIALYAEPDYLGSCVVLGTGSHTSSALGVLGDNSAASIKVGSQVWATLFIDNNYQGRGESFRQSDSNLEDNRVGADNLSSLIVQASGLLPSAPRLIYPGNNSTHPANASLSLAWEDTGGGTEFQLTLDGNQKAWQSEPLVHLGSVVSGVHTWQVRSRNSAGTSNWSTQFTFTVQTPLAGPDTLQATVPFTDTMENGSNGWTRGVWDQTPDDNHTLGGSISWHYEINNDNPDYDTGAANSGYLTSPSISIPSSGFALRFWYLYETEGAGPHWDQRWVQLSVDGGPYTNILQLYDDPPNFWQQSPPLDLSLYAGHSIRVRFHFETLDSALNGYKGWFIDDFSINTFTPSQCDDPGEPDESASQARILTYGSTLTGKVCPSGDVDYFRFTGAAGDQVGISAIAGNPTLPDTYLFLLDGDFSSVLAENDDRYPGYQTDSFLTYRLTRAGTYFIKLRAWNHPSAGGSEYNYSLSLAGNDTTVPNAQIISPSNGSWIPFGIVPISILADDQSAPGEENSGISHVDFLWHPGDWDTTDWIFLGSDWDSSDGWGYNFDTSSLPEQSRIAIYARVYDWAGNWRGVAIWNLRLDLTPYDGFLPLVRR